MTLAVAWPGPAGVDAASACDTQQEAGVVMRTDLRPLGDRVAEGHGPLSSDRHTDAWLGGTPAWILADPSDRGTAWLVALDDGNVLQVSAPPGVAVSVRPAGVPPLAPGVPPLAVALEGGPLAVCSALDTARRFAAAIPGARTVEAPGEALLAITGPTRRYPHAVLGDDVEGSRISLIDPVGERVLLEVGPDAVIEGLSPMLADLDGDGAPEVVVTVSTLDDGARLVAYDLAGQAVAASDAIGQGFRWLHQVGAGPTGPEGETELIAVRTPHIGGIVEAYRQAGDRLVRTAAAEGYSSHRIGSSNLDMALLADADGDGRLDVVVPAQDMRALGLLGRTPEGFEQLGLLELGGMLTTNVAATADAQGGLVLAAGTDDGRMRIFHSAGG